MTDTYKTYDVLLSFRGNDTRKGFTDHLFAALYKAGYKTFRDEEEIPKTESIRWAIRRAIVGSRMAIIVFSENSASSVWCLEEIADLMDCRSAGLIVLPVFYKVEPCEVREQKGKYGEAFAEHKLRSTDESIKRWRNALRQAADLGGMVLGEGYESPFIESIVKEVRQQLNYNLSNNAGMKFELLIGKILPYLCGSSSCSSF